MPTSLVNELPFSILPDVFLVLKLNLHMYTLYESRNGFANTLALLIVASLGYQLGIKSGSRLGWRVVDLFVVAG